VKEFREGGKLVHRSRVSSTDELVSLPVGRQGCKEDSKQNSTAPFGRGAICV